MSAQGLNSLDNILDKINHYESDISTRAITNLEIKINLKTINLSELTLNMINKLILTTFEWIAKNIQNSNEILLHKAIYICKEALNYSNDTILVNLKAKNVMNFIESIINSNYSQKIKEICEEFIKLFVSKERGTNFNHVNNSGGGNNNVNYEENQNYNYSQEREDNFTFNLQNTNNFPSNISSKLMITENYDANRLQETFNNFPKENYFKNTNNSNTSIKNNFVNHSNNFDNHSFNTPNQNNCYYNNIISHSQNTFKNHQNCVEKNKENFPHLSEKIKTNHRDVNNKNSQYNITSGYDLKNQTKKIAQMKHKNLTKSVTPLTKSTSFPLIPMSKLEEQILYDTNINLKFGDSIQISKTLNSINFYILEEFPIEYLLQNSELIKSILIVLEKCNHLEHDNILFRILEKILNLIEKKIHVYSHNLATKFNGNFIKKNEKFCGKLQNFIFYPIILDEKIERKNFNFNPEHSLSIRDFLFLCAEAIIISILNEDKIAFAAFLLEKTFAFLKKLMIDNNEEEWTLIINQLLRKLYEVIQNYKEKNINFELLTIIFLNFILSLSDTALIKFSNTNNFEILSIIKEILFIHNDTNSNLGEQVIHKLKAIISKIQNSTELTQNFNDIIRDYEKAQILKSSIEISKRISNFSGKFDFYTNNRQKGSNLYDIQEIKFIIDNFTNLLLTYKYYIDTNDQIFFSKYISQINYFEKINNTFLDETNYKMMNTKMNTKKITSYKENSDNLEEFNQNFFSFVKFLSMCYPCTNTKENYRKEGNDIISIREISDCLAKLISFLNSLENMNPYKYLVYLEFLKEIKQNDNLIFVLISHFEIMLGIINDLAQCLDNKNEKFELCIIELFTEIYSKFLYYENNPHEIPRNGENSDLLKDNIGFIFEIMPIYPKNMKILAINSKIEKKFGMNQKILKYLRLLFSKQELIRLNAINFFKNIFNLNNDFSNFNEKIIEYVEFTANYEKLKKLDIIYSIQTAENEYYAAYNNIISDSENLEIEFFPLLNILYSNKLDNNLKTSAIEQLINLTFCKKYTQNFCNEIIFFSFEIIFSKLNEYKNIFENRFIFDNVHQERNYISNYNYINSYIDEFYKDNNLNFISALMKLINFIILNNSENESVLNFLLFKNNENLLNFIHSIIIQLFPNDQTEKLLNFDIKKPRNKHLFSVNLIYFIYLVSYNLKNSYSKNIAKNLIFEDGSNYQMDLYPNNEYIKIKQASLLENYSLLNIQKHLFFNIIPIKQHINFRTSSPNYLKDLDNEEDCKQIDQNQQENFIKNYEIKKNIIEFIRYKSFYSEMNENLDKTCNTSNNNYEILMKNLYEEKNIKENLVYYLNEFNSDPNFIELFLNSSKLFEFYLYENFKILFSFSKKMNYKQNDELYINQKSQNGMSEILGFENKESYELVQLMLFLKCILPNSSEEKNIIIDVLNSIKIFLIFAKNFLNLRSSRQEENYNSKSKQIDISNYKYKMNSLINNKESLCLPLLQKGLNDCVYNYLSFICNSKAFINDIMNSPENQLFLIEILDLIILNQDIFDFEFYSNNFHLIIFIIKNFINILHNTENLYIIRLLITKLTINLFKFLSELKQKNKSFPNYSNFINVIEQGNFINFIIDTIENMASNYTNTKIQSLSMKNFNRKNNFQEYNEEYLQFNIENNLISFKEICLLKNNFVLLKTILETDKFEVEIKIAQNPFTFLKYLDFNCENLEGNVLFDNIVFSDIVIILVNILDKIKSTEGKIEIIKKNPIIFSYLFDFIINSQSSAIVNVSVANFLNVLIENLMENSHYLEFDPSIFGKRSKFEQENLQNISSNLDNINPINEYENSVSNYNKLSKMEGGNSVLKLQKNDEFGKFDQNIIEEVLMVNEKIYDFSSFMTIINIIKKNLKNSLVCACLLILLKKLILLAKFKNEIVNKINESQNYNYNERNLNLEEKFKIDQSENRLKESNENLNNIYDIIANSSFFEVQNEILKTQVDNISLKVNYLNNDFLNCFYGTRVQNVEFSIGYYNSMYYDKLSSKVNKLHDVVEGVILFSEILDFYSTCFAKCTNFEKIYTDNKIIIIENMNNILKIMRLLHQLKRKLNKKDYNLFFEQNKFQNIFRIIIDKFFSLIHILYFKNASIINEDFLEISFNLSDANSHIQQFVNVKEINTNIRLQNSILNLAKRKLDDDLESNFSSSANNPKESNVSKVFEFVESCYDLLVLEENDNKTNKIYFAKILPCLIETVVYYNRKSKSILEGNLQNENLDFEGKKYKFYNFTDEEISRKNPPFLKLKNEGDTILQLMTGVKEVYGIKYDNYDTRIKCKFSFENFNLNEKNTLLFGISSLLLVSQAAKKLFVKSNFISTFLDYIKQLSERLFEINLNREKDNPLNRSKISKNKEKDNNFDIYSINEKNSVVDYLISEYVNALVLLQNLFCEFDDCPEKNSLFISIEIINQNLIGNSITNFANVTNANNSKIESVGSSLQKSKKKTVIIENLTKNAIKSKKNFKQTSESDNKTDIIKQDKYEKNNTSIVTSKNQFNVQNDLAINFLKTLYEIFNDIIKYELINENYLKLLINIISKNDFAKKSFIVSVSNPEVIGNKDSFMILLLEYFQKKFMNNSSLSSPLNEGNIQGLDLFIKLLKCLFQNKQIVLFLLKIKFIENFQKDLLNLLQNKKNYTNKNNQVCLNYLLNLLVSLSFDLEVRKKIADKELIEVFTNAIIKIKNETTIYNILFILRNLSFVNQNKAHFLANENLLGTIFALLSGDMSMKIKFIISHLIWILLYNNQTLKAILNKEAFKNELISTQIHLQKDFDVKKYMNEESQVQNNDFDKYLEDACLNFKKIIHILDT